MATIGLATSRRYAELVADDRLAAERLRTLGVDVRPIVWTDEVSSCDGCVVVVVRSCWDYHLMPDRFHAWTQSVEARGPRVWNPPAMMAWNTDKTYLRALRSRGSIGPSRAATS